MFVLDLARSQETGEPYQTAKRERNLLRVSFHQSISQERTNHTKTSQSATCSIKLLREHVTMQQSAGKKTWVMGRRRLFALPARHPHLCQRLSHELVWDGRIKHTVNFGCGEVRKDSQDGQRKNALIVSDGSRLQSSQSAHNAEHHSNTSTWPTSWHIRKTTLYVGKPETTATSCMNVCEPRLIVSTLNVGDNHRTA